MRKWLIRTESNDLVGPVSEEKLLEMINKGELSELDEVCSGNGYWFKLNEKELVQKYLVDKEKQGFNPISEAVTRLEPIKANLEEEDETLQESVHFSLEGGKSPITKTESFLNKKTLLSLIFVLMFIVVGMIIYRSQLLNKLLSYNPVDLIVPQAHAQEISSKKNTSF